MLHVRVFAGPEQWALICSAADHLQQLGGDRGKSTSLDLTAALTIDGDCQVSGPGNALARAAVS
jgi:hypothetical protein